MTIVLILLFIASFILREYFRHSRDSSGHATGGSPASSGPRSRTGAPNVPLRFTALAIPLAWAFATYAQENSYQKDLVDQYGSRFLGAVILIGAAVVLFSLIHYRGTDVGLVSWGLLIAGTTIFPLILLGTGTFLVVERAKNVQLCGSCHLTMKAYVDDMKNPRSNSLAAVHFANRYIAENQCYECHTAYGLLGSFEAKKNGVIEVYRYYTRTFQLPVQLRHPYRDADCLKCHAGAIKFITAHADFQQRIFAGQLSCMQCHAVNRPAHILSTQEARR